MISDLFAELATAPQLSGALCRGHAPEFDEPEPDVDADDTSERLAFGIRCCRRCPALRTCRTWYDALPPTQRPTGIVAGRIRTH